MNHDHRCLELACAFLEDRFRDWTGEKILQEGDRLANRLQRFVEDELDTLEDEQDERPIDQVPHGLTGAL